MGFLPVWFGVEVRRRRRELCVLVVLIAVGLGVVLTAVAAARRGASALGKSVGDTVRIQLNTPQEVDLLADAGGTMPGGRGPRITARIVGVIRSPVFADGLDGPGVVLPSSGLFQKYRDNLLGASGRGFSVALARLTHGAAGVDELRTRMAALTGHPVQVDDLAETGRHHQRLLSYQALSVLALGLAALAAGAFVIGQYVARWVGSALADLRVLRPSGLTPGQEAGAAALGPVVAGLAGSVLGGCGAAVASIWTPVGAAADFEPSPGFDLDLAVLAPALLLVPLLIGAGAVGVAWAGRAAAAAPRSPAMSVLATADPSRFGQTHQAVVFLGYNGDRKADVLPRIARPRLGVSPALLPPQITEVRDLRVLPVVLAGCLALLAVATAGHAVSAAGHRRRHDIVVLRALGMTPRQVRWIALTQAGALAALGLVFGVPLGLALGRTLWRLVAESTPLVYVPPTPVWALALAVPVGLVAASALAALPARAAARLHLAGTLRAE
ncbi:FtsX-like permease family protein [Acrocarpospora catenulata]|uniref:FtsX-like permease family protein n=1 Tax=Acrocarpospora catenulata TaxID=2836182 RepID=UPI001BD94891|nr:FtsX-like permease family protein [Acrocarpospora catenulata]